MAIWMTEQANLRATSVADFREACPAELVFSSIRVLRGDAYTVWFFHWPDGMYTRAVSVIPDADFMKRARIKLAPHGFTIEFPFLSRT